jgi:hypothetical protein
VSTSTGFASRLHCLHTHSLQANCVPTKQNTGMQKNQISIRSLQMATEGLVFTRCILTKRVLNGSKWGGGGATGKKLGL